MIYRHILSHRDDKRRLSHSWASSDDDEVRVLPARGHLIYIMEARCQTTDPLRAVSSYLYFGNCSLDQGINRNKVTARVLLSDLKEGAFSLLNLLLHIDDIVVSTLERRGSHPYQATAKRFVVKDIGVSLKTTGRHHLRCQAGYVGRSSDFI